MFELLFRYFFDLKRERERERSQIEFEISIKNVCDAHGTIKNKTTV